MSGWIFAAPVYLWALAALPCLWLLLRLTPPKPKLEIFPPLRLLQTVPHTESAAKQSPWWLTLLRLLTPALLILALAQPVRKYVLPLNADAAGNENVILLLDNGWAAAPNKTRIAAQAKSLIAATVKSKHKIYIMTTADPSIPAGPFNAKQAQMFTDRLHFSSAPVNRAAAFAHLAEFAARFTAKTQSAGDTNNDHPINTPPINGNFHLAYLTDGLQTSADTAAFAVLSQLPLASLLWYQPEQTDFIGITALENAADAFRFSAIRSEEATQHPQDVRIRAYDAKSRILAEQVLQFPANSARAEGKFILPAAIRNDIAWLRLAADTSAGNTAAAIRLADTRNKQKIVAVLAERQSRLAQPLLSPLYYVVKALEGAPYIAGGEALQSDFGVTEQATDNLLAANPSLLIIGDTANFTGGTRQKISNWVSDGGTLLRFAGNATAHAADANTAQTGTYADAAADNDKSNANSFDTAADVAAQKQNSAFSLLPVPLRRGERSFGGALNPEQPQHIALFLPNSPFYGLNIPPDVTVSKQILAEPSAELYDKTWAMLADGTPLITAAPLGKGRLIFVHTGLDSAWSNLALSGFFVEMLQRIVALSGKVSSPVADTAEPKALQNFAPYLIITPSGALETAPDYIRPLETRKGHIPQPNFYTPPGLYGNHSSAYPLNLLHEDSRFTALQPPQIPALQRMSYGDSATAWQKILLRAAFILFLLDCLLSIILKTDAGKFFGRGTGKGSTEEKLKPLPARLRQKIAQSINHHSARARLMPIIHSESDTDSVGKASKPALGKPFLLPTAAGTAQLRGCGNIICRSFHNRSHLLCFLTLPRLLSFAFAPFLCGIGILALCFAAAAQTAISANAAKNFDPAVLAAQTRLAYVLSGNADIDTVTQNGLQNLSRFIGRRTTINLGDVVAVNPADDDLSFYPLLYWAVDAGAPMPASRAIAKTDAYMHHGGTVLFDTRDALQGGLQLQGASANTARLQVILAGLNIPPLIPAPPRHVLARSFYIMPDFPGRYRSSPLWITADADAPAEENRSIRAGDGISPILITANDFAAAWADDSRGGYQFPLIPDGEEQRLWSFRGGLNIVMYILTGNYKADQMHTPELLRRLEQAHQ